MAYDEPNYTQIPNVLLDERMAEMGLAELKVTLAVARKTIGWHKEKDRISLSQLIEITGLSRQGAIDGVEAAVRNGSIKKEKDGNSFSYSLLVKPVDRPSQVASQATRPFDKPNSQASRPLLVKLVDTQKKVKEKTTKERDGGGGSDSFANIVKCYEDNIGMATPIIGEKLADLADEFPETYIIDAIGIAVSSNVRRLNYVEGILNRWRTEGRQDKKPATVATVDQLIEQQQNDVPEYMR